MSIAIDRASGSSPLTQPTQTNTADPAGHASRLVAGAQTPLGTDLSKIHADIAELARHDPAFARDTHAAVAQQLDPVDAGNFLSGIFDKIGDFFGGLVGKVREAVQEARTEGTDGKPATSGVDLATTPATPADAPATINFSRSAQATFDQQWADSFPGGSAKEQGGTLVFDKTTGQIDVINIGGNGSTAGTFTPDYTIPDPSKTGLLGVFHTHPYDSGDTGISFSGADVAVMINEDHPLIMAQSGDRQFVMMQTEQTPANVDYTKLNNDQNARISELVGEGQSFADAASQAASEVATKYHLAYYEGSNGQLSRINP
ncbi:hypothetical protein M0208_03620 [Sphingomonas sp. SUN019]|uniref:hypothetical protein n=1 Tax=Sphingomonas sp. SUN019 TaxID=2937788 RepID=UPI002164CBD5|nr:hypothetical protein [Sphingomonas sp. SUN019]UVO49641.1 hypothetical protein M0208_03620 [Sphingomonas sp. SUN019]